MFDTDQWFKKNCGYFFILLIVVFVTLLLYLYLVTCLFIIQNPSQVCQYSTFNNFIKHHANLYLQWELNWWICGAWTYSTYKYLHTKKEFFGQTRTPNHVISTPASYPLCHRSCVVMHVISSNLNSINTYGTSSVIML